MGIPSLFQSDTSDRKKMLKLIFWWHWNPISWNIGLYCDTGNYILNLVSDIFEIEMQKQQLKLQGILNINLIFKIELNTILFIVHTWCFEFLVQILVPMHANFSQFQFPTLSWATKTSYRALTCKFNNLVKIMLRVP